MAHYKTDAAEALIDVITPVLDKGHVRLVTYMGGDTLIEDAARISYKKGTRQVNETAGLLNYLAGHKHTSPFEFVKFVFHIKAPIFVVRQWIRHRMANYNEMSGRYSELPKEFYIPEIDRLQKQASNNRQGSGAALSLDTQTTILQMLIEDAERSFQSYDDYNEMELARELARMGLPLSTYTEFYWGIDLHNLSNFLRLRGPNDGHAQYEIQVYATPIAACVEAVAPLAYAAIQEHIIEAVTFSKTEWEFIKNYLSAERICVAAAKEMKPRAHSEFLKKCGFRQ